MKIHVDKLNSRIDTDNPDLLRALYELYSFKIPGSEYSTAYKRRQWDGKTHFISKSGVFQSGLLCRLLADLKKIECEPEIEHAQPITSQKYNHQTTSISGFTNYSHKLINFLRTPVELIILAFVLVRVIFTEISCFARSRVLKRSSTHTLRKPKS